MGGQPSRALQNDELEWAIRRVAATACELQRRRDLFKEGHCRVVYLKDAERAHERATRDLRTLQGDV